MHPTTSYWAATRSPARNFGSKENRWPQCGQNPASRPGRPSRPRPTSASQWAQNRLFSATCGSARITVDGSLYGTGGTSTRPAPRLPRLDRPDRLPRDPVPRRDAGPADPLPVEVARGRPARFDTDCDRPIPTMPLPAAAETLVPADGVAA